MPEKTIAEGGFSRLKLPSGTVVPAYFRKAPMSFSVTKQAQATPG
jgi:hypothetical protein